MASIWYLPFILAFATAWLFLLAEWGIANLVTSQDIDKTALKFPSNLEELQNLAKTLQQFYHQNIPYVLLLFSSAYLYKQTFAIPGSVFLNVLSGAVFGPWKGFILACFLTALGASFCFLVTRFCAKKFIVRHFHEKVDFLQQKILENKDSLPYFLLFLRLFPMTPNWFLNMAAPVVEIPLHLFYFSVLIGLMPYNFICVQTGVILTQLKSLDDVFSFNMAVQLGALATVALVPGIILKRKHKLS